jgi:hypothetical protein
MRTVGAKDLAEDKKLLSRTLNLYEKFEHTTSPMKVVFPWFPTPKWCLKMYYGVKLHSVFQQVIRKRQRTGLRLDDAVQQLLDEGESPLGITGVSLYCVY